MHFPHHWISRGESYYEEQTWRPQLSIPQKIRVLCLDDQLESLRVRKILLEQLGCEVINVKDGLSCIRRATEEPFDVALLDYHLAEEITGEDVARDLRACRPRLPLVMLTGDPKIPDSAKRSVDAVLIKGAGSPLDLINTIRRLAGVCRESTKR